MSTARWVALLSLLATGTILVFRYQLGFSIGYEDCMRSAASHASTNSATDRLQNLCFTRYDEPYQTREPISTKQIPPAKWVDVTSDAAYLMLDSDAQETVRQQYRHALALRSFEAGASAVQVRLHIAKFDVYFQPTILNRVRLWWLGIAD